MHFFAVATGGVESSVHKVGYVMVVFFPRNLTSQSLMNNEIMLFYTVNVE